jgi:8-oxo-dGTP pyrophosphatase MutT (NUDIX family)
MPRTIRIAAALLVDGDRTLLVRKRGATAFMQPGGKLEPGETAEAALIRELSEELGLTLAPGTARPLGQFSAIAANEPDAIVTADLFEVRLTGEVHPAAEIEEIRWVGADSGELELAPLTRDHVLPAWRRA